MKKVLLPTDFSDNAFNAILYAVGLFEKEECTFFLLNTYTPVLYDSDYILYSPASSLSLDEIYNRTSLEGLEKVKTRIQAEVPNKLHHFETVSSFSLLNEEIKEQVEKNKIDIIIMGTKGITGAAQILFGTNTVNAIAKASCPLLAIPSSITYKPQKNIVFATDYEINYTKEHLEPLLNLVEQHNSLVHILHISFTNSLNARQEAAKALLADFFKGTQHQFYCKEKNTVTEGINDFLKEKEVDMLVMISNKHSFFDNILFRPVINEIGFRVKIPFLVIPSGKFNT